MLIIWLKVRGFLELEEFGESANPYATERVKEKDSDDKFHSHLFMIQTLISNEETYFEDFLVILKHSLQNS